MNKHWIKFLPAPLLAALLVACPDAKVTGIDASATPTAIASGGTSSLSATVTGTGAFNPGVNWSIVSGGGILSATTGSSVTYTAPSVLTDGSVQIKATAAGDAGVSKTVTVQISTLEAGVWDASNWDAAFWQ